MLETLHGGLFHPQAAFQDLTGDIATITRLEGCLVVVHEESQGSQVPPRNYECFG